MRICKERKLRILGEGFGNGEMNGEGVFVEGECDGSNTPSLVKIAVRMASVQFL